MEQYIVKITDEAWTDIQHLGDHIAFTLQAPLTAKRQVARIITEILSLDIFPDRYRIIDIEPWKSRETRCMPVDNYSVFYTIRDHSVVVTDVIYSASGILSRL